MSVSIIYVRYTIDLECDICNYCWIEEGVDCSFYSLTGADYPCPKCEENDDEHDSE
jgi:hypothetical protein